MTYLNSSFRITSGPGVAHVKSVASYIVDASISIATSVDPAVMTAESAFLYNVIAGIVVPAPKGPWGPVGPITVESAPVGPVSPVSPVAPVGPPEGPVGPSSPSDPIGPVSPSGPSGPVSP